MALAGIVFFLKIGSKTEKVSAAWWDDMWHYRKAISIENTSGSNLTDFQVSISIGTSQLIADGKMQIDCDDIRITDINGNLLPHWIEENNPGCNQLTDTKIWLKANSLPTSGATIYIYYGNQQASNNENGKNVFLEFDDFNNPTTLSNWTPESNSQANYFIAGGTMSVVASSGDYNSAVFGSNYTDVIVNSRYKVNASQTHGGFVFRSQTNAADNSYQWVMRRGSSDNRIQRRTSGGQYYLLGGTGGEALPSTLSADNWYPVEFRVSGTQVDTYFNNQQAIDGIFNDTTYTTGKIGLLSYDGIENYDYIFVRKFNPSDPTPSLQFEEVGTGPIAYWKFDEGVGTTAYNSVNTQHGILNAGTSAPTWQNEDQCINVKCIYTQGNSSSYVDTNYDFDLDYNSSSSISFWFKPSTSNTGGLVKNIIAKNSYQFIIAQENQLIKFIQWQSTGSNALDFVTPNFIQANTWYHLEFIYDSNQHKGFIYINGKLSGSASTASSDFVNRSETLKIGTGYQYGGSTSPHFNGYIDEVKIYPYARTADQIKQDYNSRGSLSGAGVNLGIKSSTAPDLKSKLIAHWKFDENNGSTVYDSSGNNNTVTFGAGSSAPTWASGKSNQGLSFDGNDYISKTDGTSSSLDVTNITLSAWIYPTVIDGSERMIFEKGYANGWEFSVDRSGLKVNAHHGGSYESNFMNTNNNGIIVANKWHHVVWTYDGSVTKLYLNGKVVQALNKSGDLAVNNSNLYISSRNASYGFFQGIIDEPKIYNRALTDEEIKQDYNAGSAIQFGQTTQNIGGTTTSLEYCIPGDTSYCALPVAEWKIDEGVGASIVDTSGNNFAGTISNATWSQGKIGKSLNFNGESSSAYISTQYPSSSPTSFTAEVWIKPNSISGAGEHSSYGYTIMAASSSGSQYPVWITLRNGEIRASAFVGALAYTETIGANIQVNNWYHVAVSATQNSTATIYINGIGKTSFTAGNVAWNTTEKLTIADLRPTRNISFNGLIDHVKIYDYARTPAQIAYDYNKGGPIGWWKFDECQGNIAYDWSGVGNTGSINIGPSGNQNSLGACAVGTSAAWTNGATGKINSSLNFDGYDDRVNLGNPASLQVAGTKNFSVAAWIYSTQNKCGREGVDKAANTLCGLDTRGGWSLGGKSGTLGFHVSDSTNTQYRYLNFNSQLNTWYHLVGIRNGNNLYLYVNGKINQIGDVTGFIINDGNNLSIGGNTNLNWLWPGQIDDVRIYNYALTSEQVKTVYNNGAINFN